MDIIHLIFLIIAGLTFVNSQFQQRNFFNNFGSMGRRQRNNFNQGFVKRIRYSNPEEIASRAGYFEGDMAVNLVRIRRKKRGVMRDRFQRWDRGLIPFQIDPSYSRAERDLLIEAMQEITANTVVRGRQCIFFTPQTNQADHIYITPDIGCYSTVGRIGGNQTVSLTSDCFIKGTIMHELLHTIGLWHEQSRVDRDNYITINYDNIRPELNAELNFRKYPVDHIDDLGLPYDFNSIMHYGFAFFAKDGISPTISPNYPFAFIGQRVALSDIDIKKVQILYGCGGRSEWDCDFENGNLCSWFQDKSDQFDWTIKRGVTPTGFTGPSGDHTNGLGFFIYAEADGNDFRTTRLVSTKIPMNFYCIRFMYYMAGFDVGTLRLLASGPRVNTVLFEARGHQRDEWTEKTLEFQAPGQFVLVFEARMTQGSFGDIALDDITVAAGFCKVNTQFRTLRGKK